MNLAMNKAGNPGVSHRPVGFASVQFRRDGGPETVIAAFSRYLERDNRESRCFALRAVSPDQASGEAEVPGLVQSSIATGVRLALRILLAPLVLVSPTGRDRAYTLAERGEAAVLGRFLAARLLRWARARNPAALVALHVATLPAVARAARIAGIPYLYFEIASPISRDSTRAARRAMRGAFRVFAPSHEAAKGLIELDGLIEKPEVMPWPVEMDASEPVASDRCRFGSIGRHSHEKRMDDPVRAAVAIGPDSYSIEIVGDGPLLPEHLEFSRENGLEGSRVEHVPFVGDIREVLGRIDVLITPSQNEGFSVAMIEAMAAGRPIIATRVGGALDVIDESCGLLYEPGDIDALAVAMKKLADDPDLREAMARASRERYQEVLAPEAIGERVRAAVDEADLSRGQPRWHLESSPRA